MKLRIKARRRRASRTKLAVAFIALFASCSSAHAVTGTWNADVSDNWSNASRWTGGIPTNAGDTATVGFTVFGASTPRTVTIDTTPRTVGTLTLGVDSFSYGYTLAASGGGTLTFDNNGANAVLNHDDAHNISSEDTISAPIILRDSLTINSDSFFGSLSIASPISGLAGKSLTINGGFGSVTLSGENTFSGGVTLNYSTLYLHNGGTSSTNSAIGTGTLTITGGTIHNSTAALITLATNNAQIWSGTGFSLSGAQGFNMGTGTISMTKSNTVSFGLGTYTLGGNITETTPGLSFNPAGSSSSVLVLSGTNTYTGGTTLSGGLVRFVNAGAVPTTGTLLVQGSGSLSVSGPYTTLAGWQGDARLSTASTGALALTGNTAENFNGSTHPALSVGAEKGASVTYSGTYTPASNGYLVGGGGGAITFATTDAFTGARKFNAGKGGGGTVIISGDNSSLTGTVTVTAGTLQLGIGGTTGSLGTPTGYTTNGTLAFNRSDDLTITLPISGTGGVTKMGAGNLTIANANYTGQTFVDRGALNLTSATPALGSVLIGQDSQNTTATLNFAAGSNVTLGNATGLLLTIASNGGIGTVTGTLDASAAASMTANLTNVSIGATTGTTATAIGILKLATNNTITANGSFVVGNSFSSPTNANSIVLGSGQNTINTPIFTFGERKAGGTMTMNTGGTLTLQGISGGTTDLTIGRNAASTTTTNPVVTADLTTGTFIGTLGGVIIGERSGNTTSGGASSATGILRIGTSANNNITMTSLKIGNATSAATGGTSNSVSGTLEFGGGTMINSGIALIGINNAGVSTSSAVGTFNISGGSVTNTGPIWLASSRGTGTLNLTGGSLSAKQDIVSAASAGTSNLVLNGGALNMNGRSIGITSQLISNLTLASGTLQNLAQFNNGAPLNKTTAGTLTLSGNNTHTGGTTVTGGTLVVASSTALGSGAVTVSGTAQVLAIDGPTAINASGIAGLTIPTGNTLRLSQIGDRFTLAPTGNFALGNITLDLNNSFNTPGMYTIIDSTIAGNTLGSTSFANVNPALGYSLALQNNDAVLSITAIPEPSTWVLGSLLALGLALPGLRRRILKK